MGKKVLLSEIRRRTKELEIRNQEQERKYVEVKLLIDALNKEIEEKKKDVLTIEEQRLEETKKLNEAIAQYEQQWNELLKKESKGSALIQFDDGTFGIAPIEDLKKGYDIKTWVDQSYIPKDVMKSTAKENYPLPKEFYIDQREGKAWAQMHFRGIEPEKYAAVKDGKMELWQALVGQSAHIDLRIDYGLERLVQFVLTENDIQSMYNTLAGEKRQTANGIMNVQHSKIVSKPSGEPPEGPDKFYKAEEPALAAVNEEGAKLAQSLDVEGSYWIDPGGIGATVNTYSYMMLIWEGKIISGTERHDLHELFMFKENAKAEIFNGKFTIKCLNDGQTNRWEIWKAISEPYPMDPIMHSDCGYHWLVPEEKVDGLGREYYRDTSKSLYGKKYV